MSTTEYQGTRVAALVMTFHPDRDVIDRLADVRPQVGRLFVVDNGSAAEELAPVRGWVTANDVELIGNERNLGTAVAINQAARLASDQGFDWLLTLDQDTVVTPTLVADLLRAARMYNPRRPVGVAGPTAENQRDPRCDGRAAVRRRVLFTSGSLIRLDAWRSAGPLLEDWFIDMVEAEFCLRIARHGYAVILACGASIEHSIGRPTRHRLLGREVSTTNHPAWRRYYLTRNRVLTWRGYWRHAPAWVAFDAFGHWRDTLFMALFETGRAQKLKSTRRGLVDGLRGRAGRTIEPR